MTEQELQRQRDHEEDLARLRGFRPVDDTFMRILFRDNLPLAEYVLRIIIDKEDLHLTPTTQAELVQETETKQFVSAREKEVFRNKQDKIQYVPVNQAGDTMQGPLILSTDTITAKRQAVTKEYVDQKITALTNGAPEALNTLYELAEAINRDPNFAVTMSSIIGQKLDKKEAVVLPEANKLLYLDNAGELNTNAASATRLKQPFTLRLTGDIEMDPVQIDGTEAVIGNTVIDELNEAEIEILFNQA